MSDSNGPAQNGPNDTKWSQLMIYNLYYHKNNIMELLFLFNIIIGFVILLFMILLKFKVFHQNYILSIYFYLHILGD